MAHTASALLSRGRSVIAVAGATGRFGRIFTETLLSPPFKSFFSRVVALTRDASSEIAVSLKKRGAELVQIAEGYSEAAQLRESLKGVDILVSALNRTDRKALDGLAEAAIDSGVVVYFPAEYGTDHRYDVLPVHKEWGKKQQHYKYATDYAKQKGRDVKIVAVYTGPFTEESIDPRYGIDLDARIITVLGPRSSRITFTTRADLARAITQLAILSMSPSAGVADSIPGYVRFAGCSPTMTELADMLSRLDGGAEYKVIEGDGNTVKKEILETEAENKMEALPAFMRVLIGEGKMDFSRDNLNELVNPQQQLWKWTTLEDFELIRVSSSVKVLPRTS